MRFPTSLSPFPPPAMAASANTRQAKGRPSTGSAGDQGADYDLPGDQTSGRGGAPPQRPPRKILENVPYSHLGRGVKGGWHQGGARTIHPPHPSTRRLAFARFRRMRTAEAARVPAVLSHGCAGRRLAPSACATVRGAYRLPDRWGLWHVSAAIAVSGWHAKR